jgi:hypothetical protein
MKISVVFVFLLSAMTASAQDSYRGMDLAAAMEIHSGITAGWLIGKRCKLLTPEELSELEKNRGIIRANLEKSWNPAYFPAEEEAAAEVASEKPYSDCGRDAKQAVSEAVQFAREWAAEISAGSSTK